ncbi:hypothetical protein A2U01_0052969, partial [Trifolium medium]|nr:hypothetical protein [Trifolium medium]
KEEEDEVDFSTGQHHTLGVREDVDGDVSLEVEGKKQPTTFVSDNKDDDNLSKILQKEIGCGSSVVVEVAIGESQCEKGTKGDMMLEEVEGRQGLKETCLLGNKCVVSCGPGRGLNFSFLNKNRSPNKEIGCGGTRI